MAFCPMCGLQVAESSASCVHCGSDLTRGLSPVGPPNAVEPGANSEDHNTNWYLAVWTNFAKFQGRASRMEYWGFHIINLALFLAMISVGYFLQVVTEATSLDTVSSVFIAIPVAFLAASAIASIAVTVRRLHDTNRSGWWWFIGIIPIFQFVLLVWLVLDSHLGENRHGPDPKATER